MCSSGPDPASNTTLEIFSLICIVHDVFAEYSGPVVPIVSRVESNHLASTIGGSFEHRRRA